MSNGEFLMKSSWSATLTGRSPPHSPGICSLSRNPSIFDVFSCLASLSRRNSKPTLSFTLPSLQLSFNVYDVLRAAKHCFIFRQHLGCVCTHMHSCYSCFGNHGSSDDWVVVLHWYCLLRLGLFLFTRNKLLFCQQKLIDEFPTLLGH